MKSIFGITPSNLTNKFTDHFDVVYDDDHFQAVSKKVFKHDDEGLTFEYQYVVSILDTATFDDGERQTLLSLDLVPCFDSLHENSKDSVLSACGYNTTIDVADYGFCVPIGYDTMPIDDDYLFENDERLDLIASVYEDIDRLRGFYLDKPINRLGTTGWDCIDSAINHTDMFANALKKSKHKGN